MIDLGVNNLIEDHLTGAFPPVRYQCEGLQGVLDIVSDYKKGRIAVATTDYIGSDDRPNERIAASFIKLQMITRQAAAFGYIPEDVECVFFIGGKGCLQDTEHIFGYLVEHGACVLYDNCYGYGNVALIKDEYLIRPAFDSSGRFAIGRGPATETLKALTASRMISDVSKEFAAAITPDAHSFAVEGVALRHRKTMIEIATLGKRKAPNDIPQWQRREFEHAAQDYDFLKNMVIAARETPIGRISDEVTELTEIWKNILEQRRVFFSLDESIEEYKNNIMETARDIGIGDAVDTYYKGVPASDITA